MTSRIAALSLATVLASSLACADAVPSDSASKPAPAAGAAIGAPAPDFTLADTDGKTVSLSSLKGKVVVLEWFNPDCPFIVSAHGEKGALRALPEALAAQGVTWLSINSSAEGKQGHGRERNAKARTEYAMKQPVLLDPDGKVGLAYGAKTTPHVFVIDSKGTLVYKGGVDNAPMGETDGGAVEPWLRTAVDEVLAGKPVTRAETKSYGCSVKYASK